MGGGGGWVLRNSQKLSSLRKGGNNDVFILFSSYSFERYGTIRSINNNNLPEKMQGSFPFLPPPPSPTDKIIIPPP